MSSSILSRLNKSGRKCQVYEGLDGDVRTGASGELVIPGDGIELTAASVAGIIPDETFTVDQAVNNLGFGRFQVKLSLITGLCWMADSMEMMILSIISPALHCSWGISSWQQALVTTFVFLGMMISATFWGYMCDRYGRKTTLLISSVLLSYNGLLSAFSPSFIWLLILRFVVGFGIGCVPQTVTLYAEFLPVNQRAKCVVLLESFWVLGACFEVLLALFIMPSYDWRWLLALSCTPVIIFSLVCVWLPESVRFLAAKGDYDKTLAILQQIARENGKPMPLGRLVLDDVQEIRRGKVTDLLIPELKRTTLLLWFIWLTCAFCYYGVVLLTTEIFEAGNTCMRAGISNEDCLISCKKLQTKDYIDLLWITLAEFPGILITTIIIERFGRKMTMAVEFFIFTLFVFLLFICTSYRYIITLFLFGARGIVSGVFQAAYVYTPEVYPTTIRAIGVGTCSGVARIGAMITPFVAQVLFKISLPFAIGIYGGMGILAGVATFLLPIETKGRELKENTSSR